MASSGACVKRHVHAGVAITYLGSTTTVEVIRRDSVDEDAGTIEAEEDDTTTGLGEWSEGGGSMVSLLG